MFLHKLASFHSGSPSFLPAVAGHLRTRSGYGTSPVKLPIFHPSSYLLVDRIRAPAVPRFINNLKGFKDIFVIKEIFYHTQSL
jgi:hypothetical protein